MLCIPCYAVLCCTMFYDTKLYQNISNYIVLSFIIFHCTVLYYAILYLIILYYTTLYYAIYCQILPGARWGPSEAVDLGPCASQLDKPSSQPSWLASGKNWPSGNSRKNQKNGNSRLFHFSIFPFFRKIEK